MSRQVLIEQRCGTGSLQLNESASKQMRPGCLGTISGPCADYKNVTRNGTFYSRKLWENVFNNELVKEALEDRVLIGELDHPQDRLETKAANACIVMTDYAFDDENQVVNGTFDILDTGPGRILKSLLDYGCHIGVSSRGEGDITTTDGKDVVDEDTYYFVGFDAVALPSVKKAKPTLVESVQHKSLKESLSEEIKNAKDTSQLEIIKNVLNSTKLPDIDSLLESIDIKSKELKEGSTTSTDNKVLLEDLEKANLRVKELESKIDEAHREATTCRSSVRRILESKKQLFNKLKSLERSEEDLRKDYSELVFESNISKKKIASLEESLSKKESRIKELISEVRTTGSSNLKISGQVRTLSESVRHSDQLLKDSNRKLSEATKLIGSQKDKMKALNESNKSLQSKIAKSQEDYSSLLEAYAKVQAQLNNIDFKVLKESLKPTSTLKEVDILVEGIIDQKDRYSSLKIARETLVGNPQINVSNKQAREVQDQSSSFLDESMRKMI